MEQIKLTKPEGLDPRTATWVAEMNEVRQRLITIIEDLDEAAIDFTPDERRIETIGTLLFHIAAIEFSWIFEDIYGEEFEEEEWKYAFALRPNVNIPQIKGKTKDYYIKRLANVRERVLVVIPKETNLDRLVLSDDSAYFSIEWILFHLIEHEAMHIGQILFLKRLYALSLEKDA
ncbi:MAG: DinB family protein [Candidatus Heimdallarchaeota archaeon]